MLDLHFWHAVRRQSEQQEKERETARGLESEQHLTLARSNSNSAAQWQFSSTTASASGWSTIDSQLWRQLHPRLLAKCFKSKAIDQNVQSVLMLRADTQTHSHAAMHDVIFSHADWNRKWQNCCQLNSPPTLSLYLFSYIYIYISPSLASLISTTCHICGCNAGSDLATTNCEIFFIIFQNKNKTSRTKLKLDI